MTLLHFILGWFGVSIIVAGLFHFLLAPRRHERDSFRFPPLPQGSLQRDDDRLHQ